MIIVSQRKEMGLHHKNLLSFLLEYFYRGNHNVDDKQAALLHVLTCTPVTKQSPALHKYFHKILIKVTLLFCTYLSKTLVKAS